MIKEKKITKKKCKSCENYLDLNKFSPNSNIKDGFENKCRQCRQKQRKSNHKLTCENCDSTFNSAKKTSKFCSSDCAGSFRKKRVLKKCSFCGKEVETIISKAKKQEIFYCNINCKAAHQKIILLGEKNPNYNKVKYSCSGCGKEIYIIPSKVENQKFNFCDNKCYKKNIGKFFTGIQNPLYKEEIEAVCTVCNKKFKRKPGQFKSSIFYCSKECYVNSPKPERKIDRIKINCDNCGKRIEILKCQTKGKNNIYCSSKCRNISHGKLYKGKNHPNFNPNLSLEERITNRKYNEYYEWRKKIYKNNNFTCQSCGDDKGGNLIAHHLNSYRVNKKLRTSLENGVTLCKKCHKLFHDNFGYGYNTEKQFIEFLNIKDLL